MGCGVGNLHDSEDDICLVFNAVECDGSDHHNHEVEDPVTTRRDVSLPIFDTILLESTLPGRQRICGRTNTKGHDLGRVQPGHSQPTKSEEGVEDKQEDSLANTSGLVIESNDTVVGTSKHAHGNGHTGGLRLSLVTGLLR